MPPGEYVTVEGEKLRCYTVDEGKEIARLVVDYEDLFKAAARWEADLIAFQMKIGGLEIQLEAQTGLVEVHKENAEWWRGLWTATRLELRKSEDANRLKWLPWVCTVVVGVAWGITGSVSR